MNFNQELKRALLTVAFASIIFNIFAQLPPNTCNYERPHQADQWLFGVRGAIDFSSDQASPAPTSNVFSLPNGVSAIANDNGSLLMFTNGIKVWNQGYYLMDNGDSLKGNSFATQSSLIVPDPGDRKKFYIFTVDMFIPPIFTDGVNYSVVDFNNSGFGQVTSKNNFLLGNNAQKITGTQHANGTDYWVVLHGFGSANGNSFYAFPVTTDGIGDPIVSKIGTVNQGDENNAAGYMKISPDGSKIALLIPTDGIAEVFNFNTSSGQVSNAISSGPGAFSYPFGLEFSADNSKMYVSTSPLGDGTNFLYQFDLNNSDPFGNPYIVDQFDVSQVGNADSLMGALQLGVDGRIYMSKFRRGILGMKYLGVVYNPDRPLAECNYNSLNNAGNNGFYLGGGESLIGLPNFVTTFLDIPHFTYYDQCLNDTTMFSITNRANIDDSDWNFNNPDGNQVINDIYSPGFVFSDPGNYQVNMTETFNGIDYSFTEMVTIHNLPSVEIGFGLDTIFILPGTSIQLDAGDWDYYYWQPGGSTNRYYDASAEGLYTVTVVDSNCCINSDQVYILYSELYYPSAFRPASSISVNSKFKVVGNTAALAGYILQVYDRWGGLLFETQDPNEGWDGTYNGNPVAVGTYVWRAVFSGYEINGEPSGEINKSGTVTVVR